MFGDEYWICIDMPSSSFNDKLGAHLSNAVESVYCPQGANDGMSSFHIIKKRGRFIKARLV